MDISQTTPQPGELEGKITFRLQQGKNLEQFCEKHFMNYDPDRFEAVAIRFFYGKEMTTTLYALDKPRQEGTNFSLDKMPVKKFKMKGISFQELIAFIGEINFTITAGNFPLEDMEVINK